MPGVPLQNIDPLYLRSLEDQSQRRGTPEVERPSAIETFKAAFERENLLGILMMEFTEGRDEGFNPYEADLTGYEDSLSSFRDVRSEQDFEIMKRRIDRERRNLQTIVQSGGLGIIAGLTAGILSPENLIPGMAFTRARSLGSLAKSAGAISSAAKGARLARAGSFRQNLLLGALDGAVAVGGAEAFLQATQETRSVGESAINTISAAFLSGLISGAGSKLTKPLSEADKATLSRRLGYELENGSPEEIIAKEAVRMVSEDDLSDFLPGTLSAARSADFLPGLEKRIMDNVTARAPELSEIYNQGKLLKAVKAIVRTPLTRTSFSPIRAVREGALALFSTKLQRNADRLLDGTQPVEDLLKGWLLPFQEARLGVRGQYQKYIESLTGDARRLSPEEFRDEAGRAFANDFKYAGESAEAEAFVTQAARAYDRLAKDIEENLIESGLLDRNIDLKGTAAKHFRRFYDIDAIVKFQGTDDSLAKIIERHLLNDPDFKGGQGTAQEIAENIQSEMVSRDRAAPTLLQDLIPREGSTMERTLTMPDEILAPFLIRDIDVVFERLVNNVTPRIELAKAFKGSASNFAESTYSAVNSLKKAFLDGDVNEVEFKLLKKRVNDLEVVRVFGASGIAKTRAKSARVWKLILAREGIEREARNATGDRAGELNAKLSVLEREMDDLRGQAFELQRNYSNKAKDAGEPDIAGPAIQLEDVKVKLPDPSGVAYAQEVDQLFREVENDIYRVLNADAREAESLRPLIRAIRHDADQLIEEGGNKRKITAVRDDNVKDLRWVRNRMIGMSGVSSDPANKVNKAIDYIRSLAFTSFSGGFLISSFSDAGKVVMEHGLGRSFKAYAALLNSLDWKKVADSPNLPKALAALEMDSSSRRSMAIWGIQDATGQGGFDAAVKKVRDFTGKITLQDPWNATMTAMVSVMGEDMLIELAEKAAKGVALTNSEANILRGFKLPKEQLAEVGNMFSRFGTTVRGLKRINTEKMRVAANGNQFQLSQARKWESAIAAHAHLAVPKPGAASFPRFFDGSQLGQILGMFRRFGFQASQEVLMSGLQRGDMATAQGIISMTAVGGLITVIKQALLAQSLDEVEERVTGVLNNPGKFLLDSIDRGGALGFIFDLSNISQKSLGVGFHSLAGAQGPARFEGRNLYSTLSPMAGYLEDIYQVGSSVGRREIDEHTVGAARDLLPWQTLFYARWLFDKIENAGRDLVR